MEAVAVSDGNGAYIAVYPYGHIRASQVVYNHTTDPEVDYTFLDRDTARFWLSVATVSTHIAYLKAAAYNVINYLNAREEHRLN
jgi:hypothetical protein